MVLGLVRCHLYHAEHYLFELFLNQDFTFFLSFCFLSVPQILDRFYENGNRTNTEEAYDGNFSFGDIFTGGVMRDKK